MDRDSYGAKSRGWLGTLVICALALILVLLVAGEKRAYTARCESTGGRVVQSDPGIFYYCKR